MNRRNFIVTATATLAAGLAGLPALASTGTPYRPGLVEELLAEGKTVFIDFYTDWCTTCAAQQRVMKKLKADNPAYAQSISFVAVDWDQYSKSDLSKRLAIPRRSTLVVLKGDQELGRLVAGTRSADIQALFDTALAAATS